MGPQPSQALDTLLENVLKGERRSLSRLISKVENDPDTAKEAIKKLYSQTGKAIVIGVTGPPGSGKSSLIAALTRHLSSANKRVAVVAIDPSSVFSGGALLGDRIRMKELSDNPSVFIRSMATRGSGGGLCRAAADVVRVLDAASWSYVIVETAGAGQTDLDIIELAQTVVVVVSPGWGDEIQAFKAGLMEIGDIFVINKSDLEGANRTLLDIRGMLLTYGSERKWKPPVLLTNSIKPSGIKELEASIQSHQEYLSKTGSKSFLTNGETQLLAAIRLELEFELLPELRRTPAFAAYGEKVGARELDPYTAATSLIRDFMRR